MLKSLKSRIIAPTVGILAVVVVGIVIFVVITRQRRSNRRPARLC